MHVGLVGPHSPDSFVDNIGDSLVRMGHQVSYLGGTNVSLGGRVGGRIAELAMVALPDLEDRHHHRLVRAALHRECDVVITVDGTVAPRAVATLRRHGVGVALWFPDHVSNLGRARMITAPYSALFFKEPLLVRRLRDVLDLPVWYLPEACNPRWHRPVGEAGAGASIAVVGNSYPSRILLLRRLHQAGIPLCVYGPPPARWLRDLLPPGIHAGRTAFREDKSRVFRTAAGVLNNLHPAEIQGVNARLFEATAAGGAVLCERRVVLDDLYDIDREVLTFVTFDELLGHCRALLGDPDLTRDIGDAAAKRAHAEHSYDNRLPLILEKIA